MEVKELEEAYNSLISDIEFSRLELTLREPNIFSALNLRDHEIRHSNFIAWLLDPKGSHGLGDLFIRRFVQDILINERFVGISIIDLPSLHFNKAVIRREFRNIDILIEIDDFVIVVENKLWSKEHSDQLRKYREIAKSLFSDHHKAFVFLTPEGTFASDNDNYINYGYERIVTILSDLLEVFNKSLLPGTALYINDYISLVKLNVLKNSSANQLAQKIYKNHKELLDFIEESKPDVYQRIATLFGKKISEKGWVLGSSNKSMIRFLTHPLFPIIPKGKHNYWPLKESFSFEINFSGRNGKARIYCTIAPGNEEVKALLGPILQKLDPDKSNSNQKFWTYCSFTPKFNPLDFEFAEDEAIESAIEAFWPDVDAFVERVENAILIEKQTLEKIANNV